VKSPESIALSVLVGLDIPEPLQTELLLRIVKTIVGDRKEFNSLLQQRLAVPRMAIDKFRREAEDLLMPEIQLRSQQIKTT
jgi:hypothetical protein